MPLKHPALLCGALLLSACAAAPATLDETQSVAAQFCHLNQQQNGMFNQVLLTDELAGLIREAEYRNALIANRYPDEKPPLGDGIHYQTYIDHAPICTPGRMFTLNGVRYAEVRHGFPGQPDWTWTDRLVLKPVNGEWKIDDILFAPAYKDGLRANLKRAFLSS